MTESDQIDAVTSSLKLAGLSNSQIKVYLYLLEEGVSTPPQIAKGTGIARTNCYNTLRELDDMDLIDRERNKTRSVYVAQNPKSILRAMEKRRDAVERILPELHDLYKSQKNKPTVEYYDGLEQVEDIFLQTLDSKQEILSVESTKLLYNIDKKFFDHYHAQLKKRQVFTHDLLSRDSAEIHAREVKELLGPYYKYKLMPADIKTLQSQILVWNDNVAHIALEQPYFGTIMKRPAIAGAMREIFNMAWEQAGSSKDNYP
jgi:sugar-specific transcriptional regulator TrmB